MARVEWLTVGGPAEPWRDIGLAVVDGTIPLFGTGIRIDPTHEPGLVGWAMSGLADAVSSIDGVLTEAVAPLRPVFIEHPVGAIGLDHVVVATDSLERTCRAIEDATGAPLKRVREVGAIRQGFHRIGGGGLIVEVVERSGLPEGPASIGPAKPAVQPGRSIATVRESAGLGLPVALMTPG